MVYGACSTAELSYLRAAVTPAVLVVALLPLSLLVIPTPSLSVLSTVCAAGVYQVYVCMCGVSMVFSSLLVV